MLAERHVAAVMHTISTKKVSAPTFDGELARLDRMLEAGPQKQYDEEQAALIAALGLGNGG